MPLNPALLSSDNIHFNTPPSFVARLHGLWPGPGFADMADNPTSVTRARSRCMGPDLEHTDGLAARWSGPSFCNPPYGREMPRWSAAWHHWGRRLRTAEIVGLVPARPDAAWCQGAWTDPDFGDSVGVLRSADAWVWVSGRLTFWRPIAIAEADAPARFDRDGKAMGKIYLRRWYPDACDEALPEPFVLHERGTAIGPTLAANGKPSAAPFPSLVPYWGDRVRDFAAWFGPLGTIVVRTGEYRGVYSRRAQA
jgi:hypothetical protein